MAKYSFISVGEWASKPPPGHLIHEQDGAETPRAGVHLDGDAGDLPVEGIEPIDAFGGTAPHLQEGDDELQRVLDLRSPHAVCWGL